MRILLVEHDPSVAALQLEFLSEEGHEVRRVGDRDEACRQATAERWDLLLIDPGQHPEQARVPECAPIPMVLTSGYPWARWASAAELKVAAVLLKPFDLATLAATLQFAGHV